MLKILIIYSDENCPKCQGKLRYYDCVKRITITKYRVKNKIAIKRFKCMTCNSIHREIPPEILPFKQYEKEIVEGVIEGLITSDTLGFEDYPCEMTMKRWIDSTQD